MSDGTYRVNHFTGPTANMTELVIPKTFNGKKITVVGSNDQEIFYNSKKTQFDLVLNENITKIDQYTFYVLYVKEVKGDTSGLKTIGRYAFSWANGPGAYEISLDLNYDGTIQTDYCAFNHMKVTFNLKHSTKISFNTPNSQSISYNFTDAHVYGEPVWSWAEDYSSATAAFTCTDSRCNHQEKVAATLTSEVTAEQTCTVNGERTHTASVEFNGNSYTDTKSESIPATGVHSYGEPEWAWAEDYSSATATFTCTECGDKHSTTVNSASKIKDGKLVYTVAAEFEGNTYTDTKSVDLKYTVNWVVEGETVETDENVVYGTMPEFNGETPAKASTEDYNYTFTGWSPELSAVTADVTYTAVFEESIRIPDVTDKLVITATGVTENSINVKWTNIGGDKYWVVCTANGFEKTIKSDNFRYEIGKLSPGTEYTLYARARTYDENGKAVYVNSEPITVKTVDGPPINVRIIEVTQNSVTINWDPVDGADKYWVYMFKEGKWKIMASRIDDLSYTYTKAEPDTEYQFKITYRMPTGKYDANGNMINIYSTLEASEIITAKTDAKPTLGTASYADGKVTVSWSEAPEFTKAWVLVKENGQTVKTVAVATNGIAVFKATANYETAEYVLKCKLADGTYAELTVANGIN